jgi:hypothetical protein
MTLTLALALCLAIGGFFLMAILVTIAQKTKAQNDQQISATTKQAYNAALQKLSYDPTNFSQKQRVLELGREYIKLASSSKGTIIFSEADLQADVHIATAQGIGANNSTTGHPASVSAETLEVRLQKLIRLKEQGLISEQEYDMRRAKILDEV